MVVVLLVLVAQYLSGYGGNCGREEFVRSWVDVRLCLRVGVEFAEFESGDEVGLVVCCE